MSLVLSSYGFELGKPSDKMSVSSLATREQILTLVDYSNSCFGINQTTFQAMALCNLFSAQAIIHSTGGVASYMYSDTHDMLLLLHR